MGKKRNHQLSNNTSSKRQNNKAARILILFVVLAVFFGGAYYILEIKPYPKTTQSNVIVQQNLPPDAPKTGKLKMFTGKQFRDLYNNFAYPNTEYISDDAVITGNVQVDNHIRAMAEHRGYIRRSAPVQDTFVNVQAPDMVLQERAAQPWLEMQSAAKKDGVNLNLTAAYRSSQEQRKIFLERLSAAGITIDKIASGAYDGPLDQVLALTAIPGYSRHHTGYTIDIGCPDEPTASFIYTRCFTWLNQDNYKNTKTFGWVPSYPEGAGEQGPEPESWEYVWVGTDSVTN